MDYEYVPMVSSESISKLASGQVSRTSFSLLKKLKQVVVIGLYLTTLFNLPSVTARPIDYYDGDDLDTSASTIGTGMDPGKWVNPCGIEFKHTGIHNLIPVQDLFSNIKMSVDNALSHLDSFKESFVQRTLHQSFKDLSDEWDHFTYNVVSDETLLAKLPKHKLSDNEKQNTDTDEFLRSTYLALQQVAVALEQIVVDMAINGGDFLEEFVYTELRLRLVLCTIQAAMLDRNVTPLSDASRDHLHKDFRHSKESHRDMRDFFIVRDYHKGLRYIQDMSKFFIRRNS